MSFLTSHKQLVSECWSTIFVLFCQVAGLDKEVNKFGNSQLILAGSNSVYIEQKFLDCKEALCVEFSIFGLIFIVLAVILFGFKTLISSLGCPLCFKCSIRLSFILIEPERLSNEIFLANEPSFAGISQLHTKATKLFLSWGRRVYERKEGDYLFPIDPGSRALSLEIGSWHSQSWMVFLDRRFIAILIRARQRLHTESGSELTKLIKAKILPAERNLSTAHSHQHYVDEWLLIEDVSVSFFAKALSHFDVNRFQVLVAESCGLNLICRNVNIPEIEWCFSAAKMNSLNPVE